MARTYKVEGTKDFLIWSVVLLGLGLWSLRDGWFPTARVLEKHAREIPASFQVEGMLADVLVEPGIEVRPQQPLARLVRLQQRRALEEAQTVFSAATNRVESAAQAVEAAASGPVPGQDTAALREALARERISAEAARAALAGALSEFAARELVAPTGGVVRAVSAAEGQEVIAGEPVATIDPKDHFYPFNRSLAIISLIGSAVCAYIHRIVR